jgi:hypothetical protein
MEWWILSRAKGVGESLSPSHLTLNSFCQRSYRATGGGTTCASRASVHSLLNSASL